MTNPTYYLLDVFTDQMFGGNQLALFPDASNIDPSLFQSIAREFNLPETVFLFPPQSDEEDYTMRIFTPLAELPTAGHPTIGTAHFITAIQNDKPELYLNQKVGKIKVDITYRPNGEPDLITMYQPLPEFGQIFEDRKNIAKLISVDVDELGDSSIQEVSCGNWFLLIPLRSSASLKKVKINQTILEGLCSSMKSMGIYVFSIHDVKAGDIQGRMFAPEVGITEDPATGSANGPLACYLSKYDLIEFPALSLQGYEMDRPSQIHLDINKDAQGDIAEVKVSGKSQIIATGELFLNQQ